MMRLTRRQVREVDRLAIERYGIPGIVLMENAARGLAENAADMLDDGPNRALIICGPGNNGGDGYALARHLHNAGVDIALMPLQAPRPETDAGINDAVCQRMKLRRFSFEQINDVHGISLVVDAIFGTGLDRAVAEETADVTQWINQCGKPVLSVDVPSGMDCNTGEELGAAVRATRTVTFAGYKTGFLHAHADELLGDVDVVDIGVPTEILERFGKRPQQV